jgi:hypothetical protein
VKHGMNIWGPLSFFHLYPLTPIMWEWRSSEVQEIQRRWHSPISSIYFSSFFERDAIFILTRNCNRVNVIQCMSLRSVSLRHISVLFSPICDQKHKAVHFLQIFFINILMPLISYWFYIFLSYHYPCFYHNIIYYFIIFINITTYL